MINKGGNGSSSRVTAAIDSNGKAAKSLTAGLVAKINEGAPPSNHMGGQSPGGFSSSLAAAGRTMSRNS